MAQHVRSRDRQRHEGLELLRRGRDAEDRIAPLRPGALDPDMMMGPRPEMEDRRFDDAVGIEPVDEIGIAGTLGEPQVPGGIPDGAWAAIALLRQTAAFIRNAASVTRFGPALPPAFATASVSLLL